MNKFALFAASLLMSASSFAQWTKPKAPAVSAMVVGEECYLYNKEADGFLLGANDYGTRASFSPTLGHKVYIEKGTADGSYYIANDVLQGWMAGGRGYMFMDNFSAVYVDNTKDGKTDNQYTFEAQSDGTYKIGLSAQNANYTPTNYPGVYFGAITSKNDTRLYFCDPDNSDGYTMESCQLIWYFVTPADYTAYTEAMKPYLSAIELGKSIDEADVLSGVDADVLAAAKAAYGNTSSTAEALDAQKKALDVAIFQAKLSVATATSGVEVLSLLGIATDFNDGGASGWNSTTGAQNKQANNGNNAADFSVTGNHYENWSGGAFDIGKVYATATNLPAGVYRLNALAYTTDPGNTYLYAGEAQKAVTSTNIDINQPMELYTITSNGQLEMGLDVQVKGTNWIGLDNVYLYYLGNGADAREQLVFETLNVEPDYEAMLEELEAYCQKSVYADYQAAVSALKSASSADLAQAFSAFKTASNAMAASVAAYKEYVDLCEEANDFLHSTKSESDEVFLLADYLSDDSAAEGLYNGNGGAQYILETGLLDNTQIAAETVYLNKVLMDARANSKVDGDDCTDLLQNPTFAAQGGWTSAVGPTWPMGKQDVYPVMEMMNMLGDVYQNLDNMQNGLYEFTLQAAVRPDDGTYAPENVAAIKSYAYINDFQTLIPAGQTEEITLNSADEASDAFAANTFPVKVYGLVTENKMKIGIVNQLRVADGFRLWAGGAKLTFRGKNPDVLASVIAALTPSAQDLLTQYAGSPELTALSDAVSETTSAEDAYKALIAMKAAMDDVQEGVSLYEKLKIALTSLSEAIVANPSSSKLAAAQSVLSTAQAAYDNQTYNNEEVEQAISDVNAASAALKMGDDTASEYNPTDCTNLIINPNFDPEKGDKNTGVIEGWTTSPMNGYKQYTVSYNRATIDLKQELTGLKKGKYKVTVHTYYRAGYYDEEDTRIKNGEETHLTTLYAQTSDQKYTKPVMNLIEGAIKTEDIPDGVNCYTYADTGLRTPDGTTPTAAFFAAGYYLNELEFFVGEDGKATIGLKKDEILANDYQVVGAWNLYYLGDQDCTSLIVNPNFDPEKGDKNTGVIEGWTTSPMNGYKQYTVSYNRAIIDLYQELSGLKKGNYKVTVHTYYRAGYYDEEDTRIKNGEETHLTTLYAKTASETFSKPVMNLIEGAVKTEDVPDGVNCYTYADTGLRTPDGTTPTAAFFAAGYYLNELEFSVGEDGKATIGLKKDEILANDYEVVGAWNLYYLGDPEPVEDCTSLIVNPNFDPEKGDKNTGVIEGWTTSPMNGYKQYTVSYNRAIIDLYQDLSGLTEGTYKVTVHTYYRAGYYDEEDTRIKNGEETHLTTLYAQTSDQKYTKPVKNLIEDAVKTEDVPDGVNCYTYADTGLRTPDGTTPTAAFFAAGYYLNELVFNVPADGKVRIGLKKDEILANDYEVVGAWNLYYYPNGLPTAIEGVKVVENTTGDATPVAYYSLSGVRLSAPQKGVNIVKMADGTVKKVLVK